MKVIRNYNCEIKDVNRHLASGIISVEGYVKGSDTMVFHCKDGSTVYFYHEQDCCESVWLEDGDGILDGLDIFTDCDWCEVEEVQGTRESVWMNGIKVSLGRFINSKRIKGMTPFVGMERAMAIIVKVLILRFGRIKDLWNLTVINHLG